MKYYSYFYYFNSYMSNDQIKLHLIVSNKHRFDVSAVKSLSLDLSGWLQNLTLLIYVLSVIRIPF